MKEPGMRGVWKRIGIAGGIAWYAAGWVLGMPAAKGEILPQLSAEGEAKMETRVVSPANADPSMKLSSRLGLFYRLNSVFSLGPEANLGMDFSQEKRIQVEDLRFFLKAAPPLLPHLDVELRGGVAHLFPDQAWVSLAEADLELRVIGWLAVYSEPAFTVLIHDAGSRDAKTAELALDSGIAFGFWPWIDIRAEINPVLEWDAQKTYAAQWELSQTLAFKPLDVFEMELTHSSPGLQGVGKNSTFTVLTKVTFSI
jgi:hypothetical protein